MARRPTSRDQIEALIEHWAPEIRIAFLAAIEDIVSKAEIGRIAEALERGNVADAIRAVHLDPAAFRGIETAIAQAYNAGGAATVGGLPTFREPSGGRIVIRFDARNPRAETWLTDHSSRLITSIVDDQRTAIRSALTTGMELGNNPRTTALDIVGRINPVTGRREGGIIGLTSQQERYVANARAELLSGDPTQMRAYLTRGRRDARFDRTVLKAINSGEPLDAATVNRITGRYSDGLLSLRGEVIGRTESMTALGEAQMEGFRQAVDNGAIRAQDVRRVWRTARDARVRDSHKAMEGESVGLDQPFSNGRMFPSEPGCRCVVESRIDFLANLD